MTVIDIDSHTPSETAYRRIRSDIVFGHIEPGRKLKLDHMKAQYGVGIGTLRELFNRLAAEGLVLAQGQRGFEVPPVTAKGLNELAELRLLLESHAIRQSFARGDMDWEGRVVSAHHKLDVAERRMLESGEDELTLWKRYDREFHRALISACGSSEMMETHARTFDKYQRYKMIACCYRRVVSNDEHRALREYALGRDAEAAIAVLETHVRGCVEYSLASGALS